MAIDTRSYTFDGRQGDLDHQLDAAGYPFYSSYVLDAMLDHIEWDIQARGPMTVIFKHSAAGNGRLARWLRQAAEGDFGNR